MSWPRFLKLAAAAFIVATVFWYFAGCSSAEKAIANRSNDIRKVTAETADAIVTHADDTKKIIAEFGLDMDEAARNAVIAHQDSIIAEARAAEAKVNLAVDDIGKNLTDVENEKGLFERILGNIVWIVVGVAVIAGIVLVWPKIKGWIPWGPWQREEKNRARFALDVLDDAKAEQPREFIAYEAGRNPTFRRALRKEAGQRNPQQKARKEFVRAVERGKRQHAGSGVPTGSAGGTPSGEDNPPVD